MMAAIVENAGLVTVFATPQDDTIVISSANAGFTDISINAGQSGEQLARFTTSQIDKVVVWAGAGNDNVYSSARVPTEVNGQNGDDILQGGFVDDIVRGGGGENRLYGKAGNDTLVGGPAIDRIFGANGNDSIFGNGGNDYLVGHELVMITFRPALETTRSMAALEMTTSPAMQEAMSCMAMKVMTLSTAAVAMT